MKREEKDCKGKDCIVIDISNIDTKAIKKTKEFVQEEAFNDLMKILKKDLNLKLQKKEKLYNKRTHNTIFINGKRGSGKTQFLLSIENYIKKKKKKSKELNGLYFFQPIDPTLLHDNESFLTIIIAKILNNLERQKINFDKKENQSFYKLLANLSNSIDGVINNKNQTRTSLENIYQDQTSLKLEEYMNEFFLMVRTLLNKKRLVILIDDVDMAFDKGFEVLEVIRKYLSSPYIIPIVTGDSKLYEIIIENNFNEKLDKNLVSEYSIINKQLTVDYLIKVLPIHRRVNIKTIYELADKKEIKFKYNNDSYFFRCDLCNKAQKDNKYYFRKHAYKIFKSEEAANIFVKNLFSNPLRKIIQFLHREYSIDKERFSLSSINEIKRIEKKYSLNLLIKVDSWQTYLEEGKNFFQKNDWENAIQFFEKSLKLEKTEKGYYYLGNCYYNLALWKEAEEAYKKVIKLNNEHSDAYFKMGATYRKRGLYVIAEEYYNKSIELNPNNDNVYNQLGICYIHLKDTPLAIENFKKAIDINPDNSKPYINIIEVSFLEKKKYYDLKFEEKFLEKFKDVKNIMKFYDMIQILIKTRSKEEDSILNNELDLWIEKYNDIKHPDWSFLELEQAIENEKDFILKEKLVNYLQKFKEYS